MSAKNVLMKLSCDINKLESEFYYSDSKTFKYFNF